jgi:ribonuclease-3
LINLSVSFIGQISNILSARSSNAYLAQQGFSSGLAECVFKNQSQGNTIYPGPMATTVEAVIGAVFNDSGDNMAAANGVMKTLNFFWPQ